MNLKKITYNGNYVASHKKKERKTILSYKTMEFLMTFTRGRGYTNVTQ